MDKRRRQYVPADVDLAFGNFGSKLGAKWGMEGLGCWLLFLAACKRARTQGTFTYTSDADAWEKIGPEPVGFTLDEFFTFTGKQKKTRRTCHGRVSYVVVTSWETWNTPRGRPGTSDGRNNTQAESLENTRSDGESSDALHPETPGLLPNSPPEVEGRSREVEVEDEGRAYYGLPVENELLTARLLKVCSGSADAGTERVLRSYASRLPSASLAKVIETTERKPVEDRSRYANAALRSEIQERRLTA